MNRALAPDFKQVDHIELLKAEHRVLDNGTSLFFIDGGDQDLIRIEFVFENGPWNPASPLQAIVANAMLMDGTSTLKGPEIASAIDYYGAFMQLEYTLDQSTVVLFTLNKHLGAVLPVVKSVLTDAIFPQAELDTFKQIQKQKIMVSLEKNDVLARREFSRVLFGNTRYGYQQQLSDFDRLSREEVLAYYKAIYQPANATVVVAGKVNEETLQLLNEHFGSIPRTVEAPLPDVHRFERGPGQTHPVRRPGALQNALRVGQVSINRVDPDFAGFQVLNTVLGGYFGSRLMTNIREDKGYTYGIGSGLATLKQTGYFFIASEVGAEVSGAALAEIEKEVNLLRHELVGEEELALVKNYMLGSFLGSLENAFSHADKFKNCYFFGLGYEYYDRYLETVKKVTAPELQALAEKYLRFDEFEKVVVGR